MYLQEPLTDAVAKMAAVVREVDSAQLPASTPCDAYDVRGLIQHLLHWAPIIEAAAKQAQVPADHPAEQDIAVDPATWQAEYLSWLDRIVTAWQPDSVWEGVANVKGAEVPTARIGSSTLGELVLHGWDLAVATGQRLHHADSVVEPLFRTFTERGATGRAMGLYGPEVAVPESASLFDRTLGLSGRDPAWQPRNAASGVRQSQE